MMDIKALQTKLGVVADGNAGVVTWSSLFHKCGAVPDRAVDLAVCAARWLPDYGMLDNPLRLAHFLAQLIHESGTFRYMEELASGQAYEGRADLGNTQPGDGVRYKGRGVLMITGRANYRKYGRRIGIDLEDHPELAANPAIGLHVALEFWSDLQLNELADRDDILAITKRVNGGVNGLESRQANLVKVKSWLL